MRPEIMIAPLCAATLAVLWKRFFEIWQFLLEFSNVAIGFAANCIVEVLQIIREDAAFYQHGGNLLQRAMLMQSLDENEEVHM